MHVEYNPTIQPANKEEIEKCLNQWLWLLPAWVQTLNVTLYDSDDKEQLATVITNYDYRTVQLDIYTCWLQRGERERSRGLLHELIHTNTAIIADFARNHIALLCGPDEAPKFHEAMQLELAQRVEASTQDLAHAIWEKMKNTDQ
jgi:hypothetical protein